MSEARPRTWRNLVTAVAVAIGLTGIGVALGSAWSSKEPLAFLIVIAVVAVPVAVATLAGLMHLAWIKGRIDAELATLTAIGKLVPDEISDSRQRDPTTLNLIRHAHRSIPTSRQPSASAASSGTPR